MGLIKCIEELEFKQMLSDEADGLNAVVQITAGAGRYRVLRLGGHAHCGCTRCIPTRPGFKVKEIDRQDGDVAGIKQVTMEVDGDYAFGMLKGENGVHRLVRISPYDSQARRHTSFVSVYVYPLVDDSIEIEVNPETSPGTLSALEVQEGRT